MRSLIVILFALAALGLRASENYYIGAVSQSVAPIALLQTYEPGDPGSTATLWNASISVPATADCFVVYVVGHSGVDASRRVSSITLGGQGFTGVESHDDSNNITAAVYYLLSPPTGTQTIVVTMVGSVDNIAPFGMAFSGVGSIGGNETISSRVDSFPDGPTITVNEGSWIVGSVTTIASVGHDVSQLTLNTGANHVELDMGSPIIGAATAGPLSAGSQTAPTWTDSHPTTAQLLFAGVELRTP